MGNTKGATLLGTVKFLRRHRDAAAGVLPADLHGYLHDEIRPGAWYPTRHFLELVRAAVSFFPGNRNDALESFGAAGARDHASLYGDMIFTMLEPTSQLFLFWSMQHDTGAMSLTLRSPTSAVIELRDFAETHRDFCRLCIGYLREGLALNRFTDVAVAETACAIDGSDRCVWQASWKRGE